MGPGSNLCPQKRESVPAEFGSPPPSAAAGLGGATAIMANSVNTSVGANLLVLDESIIVCLIEREMRFRPRSPLTRATVGPIGGVCCVAMDKIMRRLDLFRARSRAGRAGPRSSWMSARLLRSAMLTVLLALRFTGFGPKPGIRRVGGSTGRGAALRFDF